MAANSNRALSYALLDLAHADPKVRARTLYQVNSQFGSVSAEEKQAALTSIATKLSYEKNLDVKHALLELSSTYTFQANDSCNCRRKSSWKTSAVPLPGNPQTNPSLLSFLVSTCFRTSQSLVFCRRDSNFPERR